ncbi:protoporphyrinogen oxidase [Agrococcus sp. SL85]|uniref:protoporphyrinogen oxidase n=1 Tax=Agrococcus sp. SL85 TaxID=2995141 RepID=UPI00226CF728|nr:protoporphyrinogen oxidase [Agrococcus sp. SL85]WAC67078.1 protoporphyrinogen oxidase [Agrococcus sp. SL85]
MSAAAGQPRWDTIVAGAGMGGLVVAHELAARGYRVLVLDAAEHLGGVASRLELDGLVLDAGAESFATRGGAVAELAAELGLGDDVVAPNPAGAWLQLDDRAVPLPKATLLGIPSSPLARDVIDAVGWGGALRAYADRLMPVLKLGKDEALGPLVRRRMGTKVLDRLVAPLAGGVYSADPEALDVAVVAPGLNNALTRTGSLSGAVALVLEDRAAAVRSGEAAPSNASRPGSAVLGIRGGVHRIAEALVERARAHRAELRTGVRVVGAEQAEDGWIVRTESGEALEASSLVVAMPERQALRILGGLEGFEALAADADGAGVTVELVTLVLPEGAVTGDPRGTGVLVADDAASIRAKAMTHSSAKWPWLREAAAGREVVRLSYGSGAGAPATEGRTDAEAAEPGARRRPRDLRPRPPRPARLGARALGAGPALERRRRPRPPAGPPRRRRRAAQPRARRLGRRRHRPRPGRARRARRGQAHPPRGLRRARHALERRRRGRGRRTRGGGRGRSGRRRPRHPRT